MNVEIENDKFIVQHLKRVQYSAIPKKNASRIVCDIEDNKDYIVHLNIPRYPNTNAMIQRKYMQFGGRDSSY
jgi:hypothetical protein